MIYLFVFYWIVSGLTLFFTSNIRQGLFEFVLALIFGGLLVPARFLAKLIS